MKTTVAELASLIGGEIEGGSDALLTGVASVKDACEGDVVLAGNKRYFDQAMGSSASCVITGKNCGELRDGKSIIRVANPDTAFATVLGFFKEAEVLPAEGIGVGAVVEPNVTLGKNVAIGANCYIGRGASLGDGCVLFPNVYVGDGVVIGEGTKLYPGVTLYAGCVIGKQVILHAGVVIGSDGFGYTCGSGGLVKFPHVGTVEIGDWVEIGANSTIDRAKTGKTVIGSGTKIDNLVHIAHNVKIGSNCVIVAQCGVAGSVEVGNNVTLAAQSGIKDHVTIEDGCVVAARAGVIGNLSRGSVVSGFPARDHGTEKRAEAARLHLPDVLRRLKAVESELEDLRGGRKGDDGNAEY